MATSAVARPRELVREFLYLWEGRDKSGRVVRGEMRAGGESVVAAALRRRGILATKIKKQTLPRGRRISGKTWRCLPGSFPPCCVLACR